MERSFWNQPRHREYGYTSGVYTNTGTLYTVHCTLYSPVIENTCTQGAFTLIQVLCNLYTVQSRHREYSYTGGIHTNTSTLYTVHCTIPS